MCRHIIIGQWIEEGYLCQFGSKQLEIEIFEGTLYEVDDGERKIEPLRIADDGTIRGWPADIAFQPEPGQLEAIGFSIFA